MVKGKDNIIFSLLLANLYIILLLNKNNIIPLLHITFVIVIVESKEISNSIILEFVITSLSEYIETFSYHKRQT